MRRGALVAMALLGAAGCDGYDALLPDGGRGRVVCSTDDLSVSVRVVGPQGLSVGGASVVATWLSYDSVSATFVTAGNGVTIIEPRFGPGIMRLTARLNDLLAPVQDVTYVGGECINAVTPHDVVLRLQ